MLPHFYPKNSLSPPNFVDSETEEDMDHTNLLVRGLIRGARCVDTNGAYSYSFGLGETETGVDPASASDTGRNFTSFSTGAWVVEYRIIR